MTITPQRIAIIGCSGAGKSTFARVLGEKTGLPLYHLDRMYWGPDWTMPEKGQWEATHLNLIAGENWIIDGNYTNTQAPRFARATHIIFFDLPVTTCLWGVARRIAKDYGRTRPDMAPGCPEKIDIPFIRYILGFNRKERPLIMAQLAGLPPEIRLDTVTSRADAEALLEAL